MSDNMQSAMLCSDDVYAGSETFFFVQKKLSEKFGMNCCLPVQQGRACENILASGFVRSGNFVLNCQ
jgi:tryptophanase